MSRLRPSDRAPGLAVAEGVELPEDLVLGAHVVVHAGSRVGRGCTLQDGAVVGKPPVLGPRSTARRDGAATTRLEDGAAVCAYGVVYAGATLGARAVVGDHAQVREGAEVGPESVVGAGSSVGPSTRLGRGVRLQTGVWITGHSLVEDDVFVGPGAMTMNDNTMGRAGAAELEGVTLRRAARVGGATALLPGVEVGEEAFVAAGSLVTRDVPPRALAMGRPARVVREVAEPELP